MKKWEKPVVLSVLMMSDLVNSDELGDWTRTWPRDWTRN